MTKNIASFGDSVAKLGPPSLKIYVATSYELHASAQIYISWIGDVLKHRAFKRDVIFTSNWIFDEHDTDTVQEKAAMDFADVDRSDAVVAFWPFGKGTCAEIAWATAKGKQVIMYIPEDFYDEGRIPCMPVGLGEPYSEFDTGPITKPVITHNMSDLIHCLNRLILLENTHAPD